MGFPTHFRILRRLAPLGAAAILLPVPALGHEAWLLTPAEIEALAAAPIPEVFTSRLWLGLAAIAGSAVTFAALAAEAQLRPIEERLATPLSARARAVGGLALRLGLAAMLALAATGGLPRHGTAHWAEPTLMVPDMQLSLVIGWGWLAPAQLVLAVLLVAGFFTRAAALGVLVLSVFGLAAFGAPFLSYAPHFAAPALILALTGGGAASVDRTLGTDGPPVPDALVQPLWRAVQILFGAGFVYLAIAYKLTQPTLLIAILDHGGMPTFGLGTPVVALVMTGVELICGALLIVGRLVRPVAFAIIGAITFLAVVLGETPLFHANLYGALVVLALAGRALPGAEPVAPVGQRAWA